MRNRDTERMTKQCRDSKPICQRSNKGRFSESSDRGQFRVDIKEKLTGHKEPCHREKERCGDPPNF
jgi:hypothetical protein